jgi:hypothetical protein
MYNVSSMYSIEVRTKGGAINELLAWHWKLQSWTFRVVLIRHTKQTYIYNTIEYILYFEQNLVLRNIVRFWVGALAYVPHHDPQRRTNLWGEHQEGTESEWLIQNGINMDVTLNKQVLNKMRYGQRVNCQNKCVINTFFGLFTCLGFIYLRNI